MNDRRNFLFYGVILVSLGAGWGLTQPLTKVAVSTGYQPWGLIFWQMVIGALLMATVMKVQRRRFRRPPGAIWTWAAIACIGTLIPNTASYRAIAELPSGIISILLSLVPMIAFPIALGLGIERFRLPRLVGLSFGLVGVSFIVLPEASLPDPALWIWILVALIAPCCYAFEGNYVARWGTSGLDPIETLFGASLFGAVLIFPITMASGQYIPVLRPWGAADWALVASSVIHVLVYATYVWLVGRAGPVFAVQVSYFVTGWGVLWAVLLLNESYSGWIWAALALIFIGMFLVQPRTQDHIAKPDPIKDSDGETFGH